MKHTFRCFSSPALILALVFLAAASIYWSICFQQSTALMLLFVTGLGIYGARRIGGSSFIILLILFTAFLVRCSFLHPDYARLQMFQGQRVSIEACIDDFYFNKKEGLNLKMSVKKIQGIRFSVKGNVFVKKAFLKGLNVTNGSSFKKIQEQMNKQIWKTISFKAKLDCSGTVFKDFKSGWFNFPVKFFNPEDLMVKDNFLIKTARFLSILFSGRIDKKCDFKTSLIIQKILLGRLWQYRKNDLETYKALIKPYRDTGLNHVIAISGMHLTIVTGFSGLLLSITGIKKRGLLFLIETSLIIIFMFMTGLRVSILRAGIMAIIVKAGMYLDKNRDMFNILCFAFSLQIFYDPAVIFDFAFVFSYAAVFALTINIDKSLSETDCLSQTVSSLKVLFFLFPFLLMLDNTLNLHVLFLGPLAGIFIAGLLKASLILFIIDPFFPFLGNLLSLFMEKTAWTSDLILSLAGKNQFFRITLPTIEPDLIFLLILLTAFSMVLARKFHEFLKQNLEKLMKY